MEYALTKNQIDNLKLRTQIIDSKKAEAALLENELKSFFSTLVEDVSKEKFSDFSWGLNLDTGVIIKKENKNEEPKTTT